MYLRLI